MEVSAAIRALQDCGEGQLPAQHQTVMRAGCGHTYATSVHDQLNSLQKGVFTPSESCIK